MTTSLPLLPFGPLTPRLEVVSLDDQRSIFLNGHLVARYRCDDKGTERVLVTQLAEVLPCPDRQIAAAFDLHPVTLSRFRSQARNSNLNKGKNRDGFVQQGRFQKRPFDSKSIGNFQRPDCGSPRVS